MKKINFDTISLVSQKSMHGNQKSFHHIFITYSFLYYLEHETKKKLFNIKKTGHFYSFKLLG